MDKRARRAPVVSIGNLAMGGRGKTPVAGWVARLLVEAGERPAILSRGYGRRRRAAGVVVVSDGTHLAADLDRSGDEPFLLARRTPGARVLVHDVRAVAAELAERALGATVHVLDDGFQHASLAKDLDLVLVSADDLSGHRLPFGRLRSPVSSLAAADAVIVDGPVEGVRERISAVLSPGTALFSLRRTLGDPVPIEPERPWPVERGPVVALAGIAAPRRFTDALAETGWTVVASVIFGDHHRYSPADVQRIARRLRDSAASAVLTTEKDAVRLLSLRPLPVPIGAVPLEVTIEPAADFRQWLLGGLGQVRA